MNKTPPEPSASHHVDYTFPSNQTANLSKETIHESSHQDIQHNHQQINNKQIGDDPNKTPDKQELDIMTTKIAKHTQPLRPGILPHPMDTPEQMTKMSTVTKQFHNNNTSTVKPPTLKIKP